MGRHLQIKTRFLTCLASAGLCSGLLVGGCMDEGRLPAEPPAAHTSAETVADGPNAAYCKAAAAHIDYASELVITSFNVLNDMCRTGWDVTKCADPSSVGHWSFGYLMQEAAGGKTVSARAVSVFILNFLNTYADAPVVGGQALPVRDGVLDLVVKPWRAKSPGCSADPKDLDCTLDLTKAPLRLLALVNRTDLRTNKPGRYAAGRAGQARAVFGVVDSKGNPARAAFILEYQLPASSDAEAIAWAKDWDNLRVHAGKMEYNDLLQDITDRFVKSDALPSLHQNNGSALLALRSTELAFAPSTMMNPSLEFREFALGCVTGDVMCALRKTGMQLLPQLTALTPDSKYANNMALYMKLTGVLDGEESQVLSEDFTIPDDYLSGAAQILPGAGSFRWPSGPTNPTARRLFAISTCTGCHFRETLDGSPAMQSGFHIDPLTGQLSHFLSQPIAVKDLDGMPIPYDEKLRRQCEFQYLLDGHVTPTLTNPSGRDHS